jgi:hypothetical protein
VNVGSNNNLDLSLIAGRELELWKPIYTIAQFLDRHASNEPTYTSQPTLTTQMIQLSTQLAKIRHTENLTETGEENLILALQTLIPDQVADGWVKVSTVRTTMETRYEGKHEWLTNEWIGRAMRRLGFKDKRRLGTGIQYNINHEELQDIAKRLDVQQPEPEKEEPEIKSCFVCHMALPQDHENTTMLDQKEVHIACYRQIMGENT